MTSSSTGYKTEPKPEVLRLEELARRVKDGDIKLPKFQRPFVWERSDVLKIFDSIYKGYPVGSILLWLTHSKLSSENKIGDLEINQRPDSYPTNYLLDGQQRLSSVCGALFWKGSDEKSFWNISFDLEKERFFYPESVSLRAEYFPINRLIETSDFLSQCKIIEGHPNKEVYLKRAEKLLNSIKDYKIAAVVIGDMSLDEVAPIFERINSSGRKLTIVDLMRAATWSGGFDLNESMNAVRTSLSVKNFDDVPDTHILRNISASAGLGIHKEAIDKLREKNPNELKVAAADTEKAYRLAVDFLTSELPLTSYNYLPYALQLTYLVEFFRINPSPSIAKRQVLKRWLWDTSFSSHFGTSNTGQQIKDLQTIREFAANDSESLFVPTKINPDKFISDTFRLNKASSKGFALLLAQHHPRSLLDGTPVNTDVVLSVTNKNEFHHLFPQQYLKSSGYSENKVHQHANICMLISTHNKTISDTKPSIYFNNLKNILGDQLHSVLESNFINEDAYNAALEDNFEDFIKHRSIILKSAMTTLSPNQNSDVTSSATNLTDTIDIDADYEE